MNINYEHYRIFYIVAKNGNITASAKELMISQPAISKSIKNLEESLGGQLFIRTKRGVSLASEGKEFYNYIKNAIEYINNAEHKFTELVNLETGTIKIGVSTTLTKEFLIKYLTIFHKKYPKVIVEIFTDRTENLYTKLRNGLIDFIILNIPKKEINDIEFIKCKKVSDIFITNNKDISNRTYSLKELSQMKLILQAKGSNTRKYIDDFFKENDLEIKPIMDVTSYSLVIEFTKAGFGIGHAVKEFVTNDLNQKLFEIKTNPSLPKRYVGIAISKNSVLNFSSKKLIDIIKEN